MPIPALNLESPHTDLYEALVFDDLSPKLEVYSRWNRYTHISSSILYISISLEPLDATIVKTYED